MIRILLTALVDVFVCCVVAAMVYSMCRWMHFHQAIAGFISGLIWQFCLRALHRPISRDLEDEFDEEDEFDYHDQ